MQKKFQVLAILIFMHLQACGRDKDGGFLSDNNLCLPADGAYDESSALDAEEQRLEILGKNSTRSAIAQKTETFAKNRHLWGMELRLASIVPGKAVLDYSLLSGHPNRSDTQTLTPEGQAGKSELPQLPFDGAVTDSPSWVRVRFPYIVKVDAGSFAWIIMKAGYELGAAPVSWLVADGEGLMESADGTVYTERVGQFARFRFVDCKDD